MNINELKNILGECEIKGEKIVVNFHLAKTLEFIKNNYGFNVLKEINYNFFTFNFAFA